MSFEFVGLYGLNTVTFRTGAPCPAPLLRCSESLQDSSTTTQLMGTSVFFFKVFEERKIVRFDTVS